MTSSAGTFHWVGDDLSKNMIGLGAKIQAAVGQIVKYEAQAGQNYMRTNAPWTDQTGNARQGLFGNSYAEKDGYTIVLYHTMPYGIWLEVKHSGRYRIIEPAIQETGKNVMRQADRLISKLKAL